MFKRVRDYFTTCNGAARDRSDARLAKVISSDLNKSLKEANKTIDGLEGTVKAVLRHSNNVIGELRVVQHKYEVMKSSRDNTQSLMETHINGGVTYTFSVDNTRVQIDVPRGEVIPVEDITTVMQMEVSKAAQSQVVKSVHSNTLGKNPVDGGPR